jgi:hypothetical protein
LRRRIHPQIERTRDLSGASANGQHGHPQIVRTVIVVPIHPKQLISMNVAAGDQRVVDPGGGSVALTVAG